MSRVSAIIIRTLLCAGVAASVTLQPAEAGANPFLPSCFHPGYHPKPELRFGNDRKFTIVQFTDTQDSQNTDPRTIDLIETVLADQRPDLVVFTGDNIRSGPKNLADVKKAIDNVVGPVDAQGIPWIISFGNHDEDHTAASGVDKKEMLKIYMSYPYNMNHLGPLGVTGVGNMNVLVYGSRSHRPVFNVWALDSGKYAPDKIAEQVLDQDYLPGWTWMPDWDWLRPSQVGWYVGTSTALEQMYGKKIPGLMFFHIPLQEFRTMYDNDAYKIAHPELGLKPQHGVVGERNEDECPGPFNSGLFSAMLERGDVKGVFVGHDHVNNYVGNYFGITLGYSANTGFATYGLGGTENNRLRGARVFTVKEDSPETFETHMVYAKDYGIE